MHASDMTFLRESLGLPPDPPLTLTSPRDLQQSLVTVVNDSYFYKRCCVFDLTLKSPRNPLAKWVVTLQSFYNEHLFLTCYESFDFLVPRVVRTVVVGRSAQEELVRRSEGEEMTSEQGGKGNAEKSGSKQASDGSVEKIKGEGSREEMVEPEGMGAVGNGSVEEMGNKRAIHKSADYEQAMNGNVKKIAIKSKQGTNVNTMKTGSENKRVMIGDGNDKMMNMNENNPIMSGNGKQIMLTNTNQPINFHTKFQTLTEYMKPGDVIEVAIFNSVQSKAVLEWCATFHAFFIVDCKLKTQMFDRGGWWRKALRPTIKWGNAPNVFLDLQKKFPREFEHFHSTSSVVKIKTIAKWAMNNSIAAELETLLPSGFQTTLMHGDVKSSNFFFKQDGRAVGIDFQWVGGAVCGAADVVYMLFGSAGLVEGTGTEGLDSYEESGVQEYFKQARTEELALIKHYFTAFDSKQIQKHYGNKISKQIFDVAYDLEFLEYFSAAVPYLLADLDKKTVLKNRKKYGYLTYEKDVRMLAYFFLRGFEAYDAVASRMAARCERSI